MHLPRYNRDPGEMPGRCRGDAGEMRHDEAERERAGDALVLGLVDGHRDEDEGQLAADDLHQLPPVAALLEVAPQEAEELQGMVGRGVSGRGGG